MPKLVINYPVIINQNNMDIENKAMSSIDTNNPDKLQCGDTVLYEGLPHYVVSIQGDISASIRDIMDPRETKEGVPLISLNIQEYGNGNIPEKKYSEEGEEDITFEKLTLNDFVEKLKGIAPDADPDPQNQQNEARQMLTIIQELGTHYILDKKGKLYSIVAFDSKGLDMVEDKVERIMHASPDAEPIKYERLLQKFEKPYYPSKSEYQSIVDILEEEEQSHLTH